MLMTISAILHYISLVIVLALYSWTVVLERAVYRRMASSELILAWMTYNTGT